MATTCVQAATSAAGSLSSPGASPTPTKALASSAEASKRFECVIIDTPPVLPSTDASVLAGRADGTLIVVRLEHSSKTLTKEAVRNLQDLGAHVLGTFVTEVRGHYPEADPRLAGSG